MLGHIGSAERRCIAALCVAAILAAFGTGPASANAPDARTTLERVSRAKVAKYRTAAAKHQARRSRAGARRKAAPGPSVFDCLGPAGDPEPGTQAWTQRDYVNQYCATERLLDEYGSPAFGSTFWAETPGMYAQQNVDMLTQGPQHLHLTLGQLIPGGTTTDPFRTIERWTAAGRGRVDAISFPASDGATLNGFIFRPPASKPGPYPGIVITTGSIQGYQQMYFWAAEGLAEAGYQVLTYDVQGQGNSDTLPADCSGPGSCPGVPFQQGYNFFQGAQDALNFFLSTPSSPYTSPAVEGASNNPAWADVDASRIGVAGHSLGASAVSVHGQCDPRVDAIVAWDNLARATGGCRDQIPNGLPADAPESPSLETPALGIASEYFFNPTSMEEPPDPQTKSSAFKQLTEAGTDAMEVVLRSSTHLEYTYVPYILPASRIGERVAWYYTLAWFDRYVRGDKKAFARLTAKEFDGSADASSIGAGTYDPAAAAADPADTTAGNVPYEIDGLPVADRMSLYYASQYAVSKSGGAKRTCTDMRAECPR